MRRIVTYLTWIITVWAFCSCHGQIQPTCAAALERGTAECATIIAEVVAECTSATSAPPTDNDD